LIHLCWRHQAPQTRSASNTQFATWLSKSSPQNAVEIRSVGRPHNVAGDLCFVNRGRPLFLRRFPTGSSAPCRGASTL